MIFGSDNMVGGSEKVLKSLLTSNEGFAASYGNDDWSALAEKALEKVFNCPLKAFFVSTGTAANCIGIASIVQPWGVILAHKKAHILIDESTAPEFFTGGARVLAIPDSGSGGKVTLEGLKQIFANLYRFPHNPIPQVLSITQLSEAGLRYTPEEVTALCDFAHAHGLKVHMDGSRLANAIADHPATLAEYTWKAGVDVLTLGASKNGAIMAEAIIFFNEQLCQTTSVRIKRSGQMAAKGRFFGAQFVAWLENDHWLDLARHANKMARLLAKELAGLEGCHVVWEVEGNEVFVLLPASKAQKAREAGAVFYDWYDDTLPIGVHKTAEQAYVRCICSFATTESNIYQFVELLRRLT